METPLIERHPQDSPPEPLLQSPEVLEKAEDLSTAFGLWLLEQGYGEDLADVYSDPNVVRQRLARSDTTLFRVGEVDQSGTDTITAFPITHFQDVTGEAYNDSTMEQREYYTRREEKLTAALGGLSLVSIDAKNNPNIDAKHLRKRTVEAINTFASHDDGEKEVVNGKHFSRSGASTFAVRSAEYWLGRLNIADDQARFDLVDWAVPSDQRLARIQNKTTVVDQFMFEVMSADEDKHSLRQLLEGLPGYMAAAQLFYGGDMQKTYKNTSTITDMTGEGMPDGWRVFNGLTADFEQVQRIIKQAERGVEGYMQIANDVFGGDMQRTFTNISSVTNMTGESMPDGWRLFKGSTADLISQADWVAEQPDGASYKQFVEHFYPELVDNTNRRSKAYINFAVAKQLAAEQAEADPKQKIE